MILGNSSVKDAEILFGSENVPLYPVPEQKNLWYGCVTFNRDPIKFPLKYKYNLILSDHAISALYSGKVKEEHERQLKWNIQFDVFHFPDKRHCEGETEPTSLTWYVKWFLKFVQDSTISEILIHVRCFNFKTLNTVENYVKDLICWILESASTDSFSAMQRLYLCMILSHLNDSFDLLKYLNDHKTACDRLIKYLPTCIHSNFLSELELESLKKTAIVLVQKSSNPEWHTLALFPFSEEENLDTDHKTLLKNVLKSAPTLLDGLGLFEHPEISNLFATEEEKIDFFAKFIQEAHSTRRKSLWETLVEFHRMPEKIRQGAYKLLSSTLLEYVNSDDELQDKSVLVELIISIKDAHEITNILKNLSISMSVGREDLLPQFLGNALFKDTWLLISPDERVNICKSWFINRINLLRAGSLDNLEEVVAVYELFEAITRCSLDAPLHEALVNELSVYVETKEATDCLQAFAKLEKLSSATQECYFSHIRKILTPELIKKSSHVLKLCSNTGYVFLKNMVRLRNTFV